jgi:hypothetical protein
MKCCSTHAQDWIAYPGKFRMFKDFNDEPCEKKFANQNICGEPSLFSIDLPKDNK